MNEFTKSTGDQIKSRDDENDDVDDAEASKAVKSNGSKLFTSQPQQLNGLKSTYSSNDKHHHHNHYKNTHHGQLASAQSSSNSFANSIGSSGQEAKNKSNWNKFKKRLVSSSVYNPSYSEYNYHA